MNGTTHQRLTRVARDIVRWGIALAICLILGQRLARDWPSVRAAFGTLRWGWIVLAALPAILYFCTRVQAWRNILARLSVIAPWWPAAAVFMNSEIIRYIPGTFWAFLGRVVQGKKFAPNRMTIAASLALEMLLLACVSLGLSGLFLIGYPRYQFAERPLILVVVMLACLLPLVPALTRRGIAVLARVLRRQSAVIFSGSLAAPYGLIALAWTLYTLFHIAVAIALHWPSSPSSLIALAGITLISWFLGFVSFLTPSGLGVREGVVVLLTAPYLATTDAIVYAALSRVMLTLIELIVLAGINAIAKVHSLHIPEAAVTDAVR